jgi:hypothetical protein
VRERMWFACKPARIDGEHLYDGERALMGKRGVWSSPTDTSIPVVAEEITVHQLSSHLSLPGIVWFGRVVVRKGDDS